ncbi:MAG TPA: hypothetical protein VGB91_14835 [Rhizomicrobium sp.]
MPDTTPQPSVPAAYPPAADTRTLAIIVYGLYLGALVTAGGAGLAGVILAYVKRDEAAGTLWYSHFQNAIHAFWIWLALFVVGCALAPVLIGIPIIAVAFLYFLYRTIKGLAAAIDSRPYV